jgi:hypothetical protein
MKKINLVMIIYSDPDICLMKNNEFVQKKQEVTRTSNLSKISSMGKNRFERNQHSLVIRDILGNNNCL